MEIQSVKPREVDPVFKKQNPFPTSHMNFVPTTVGNESTIKIKMTNDFDHPLTLTFNSNSDQFHVRPKTITLAPHKNTKVAFSFKPTKVGTWFGMITVNDGKETKFLTVTGKGISPI